MVNNSNVVTKTVMYCEVEESFDDYSVAFLNKIIPEEVFKTRTGIIHQWKLACLKDDLPRGHIAFSHFKHKTIKYKYVIKKVWARLNREEGIRQLRGLMDERGYTLVITFKHGQPVSLKELE